MQSATGKRVYLWLYHVKGCKVQPCSLSLGCEIVPGTWKVNLAAKHKQTFDDFMVLLTNFYDLAQDFDNKSENCNNKVGDNLLQSGKN